MKSLIFLLVIASTTLTAQTIDYNLKKGFMAKGYDVVSYFNGVALEGQIKFNTTFDGVKYKFSSLENLNKFKENPKKYMPQYGGYCAYAIAFKSEKVSINPETFLVEDGKLYLFYNAWGTNTLTLWEQSNVSNTMSMANANWEKIKFKK
ncbi:YHS domain-containing (seleno)protein [uncultured Algibacter sp.]|uniref:YHS domain-containing (seleno)protein n=1 Tax=uncultured Algibacter sp. TaxID=298659 RepID=UPI002624B925|nr:YHS domain-containing (seleno)protein [uncultured Algibacter sp.]